MPELPEVEIVRQSLNKKIKNEVIRQVLVKNRNLRFKIDLNFEKHLKKKKVKKVKRFSKYSNIKSCPTRSLFENVPSNNPFS